jgi:hypothetical protein
MITRIVRNLVWDRAGDTCERCGKGLTRQSDHSVHHRKLLSRGGSDHVGNLLLLCGSGTTGCHFAVHAMEVPGYVVPSWDKPELIPFRHWSGRDLYLLPDGTYGEQVWAA